MAPMWPEVFDSFLAGELRSRAELPRSEHRVRSSPRRDISPPPVDDRVKLLGIARKRNLAVAVIALWIALCLDPVIHTPTARAGTRPNVVILMSDDQRWDMVTERFTPRIWSELVAGNPHAFTNSFVS